MSQNLFIIPSALCVAVGSNLTHAAAVAPTDVGKYKFLFFAVLLYVKSGGAQSERVILAVGAHIFRKAAVVKRFNKAVVFIVS